MKIEIKTTEGNRGEIRTHIFKDGIEVERPDEILIEILSTADVENIVKSYFEEFLQRFMQGSKEA
jgi:hypothetical protein